jgi:tetratricopeptide (TPR) repeat protein
LPFVLLVLLAAICVSAAAQLVPGTRTLIVMPFDNQSKAPGLEWIGEAFPEVLSQRMASSRVYAISRDDRTYAFDHAGIPLTVRPSRATMYQVAEQMDADYVVLGSYDFDGSTFTSSAQLLDMKKLHLGPIVQSKGPLTDLIAVQSALAWGLLEQMPEPPVSSREQFLKASAPIRLDAFESYIRGILATNRQQKIKYFRDAIRLNPTYTLAMLQLGKAYYQAHDYESASLWFARVPKDDVVAGEANFLLGMSEFYRGNFDKAYTTFSYLATLLPLTEVYNNLGVVESRRGRKASAVDYFSKAVLADPNDADYHFNLAVALYRNGDSAGASRQLKEELQRRSSDGEARSLLDAINRGPMPPSQTGAPAMGAPNSMFSPNQSHTPMERIKRNYDEASYRQLAMEIHNLTEERLAKKDRATHADYHVNRGRELLAENSPAEAESEFHEAILADPRSTSAHAGLAAVLEARGDVVGARSEAQASVRLKPNADALLVLARVDLKQNQLRAASDAVNQALQLEPANQAAMALKNLIAAKQTASP